MNFPLFDNMDARSSVCSSLRWGTNLVRIESVEQYKTSDRSYPPIRLRENSGRKWESSTFLQPSRQAYKETTNTMILAITESIGSWHEISRGSLDLKRVAAFLVKLLNFQATNEVKLLITSDEIWTYE